MVPFFLFIKLNKDYLILLTTLSDPIPHFIALLR